MKYGNLSCSATNCAYNLEYECKAGGINVGGQNAKQTSETTCTTFVDKATTSFTNSTSNETTKTSNIKCQALNCVYNEHKDCNANSVDINMQNASCNTFKCE